MTISHSHDRQEFVATDKTLVREVFHPRHTGIETPYSIALASLEPHTASTPHSLNTSDEVYIIVQGVGRVHVADEAEEVSIGDIVHIPKGDSQWIENISDETLIFYCIVSPPWKREDEVPTSDCDT